MRELLAFLGLSVPIKYIDQFGIEGVVRLLRKKCVSYFFLHQEQETINSFII